jgi:ferrochelatase
MLEVAEHYYRFAGKSPINQQTRALIAAIEADLAARGPALPVYWGNRNWHPMLADAIGRMRSDGVRRALAFVTSAFGSYSGCRQYREDIARAQAEVGSDAPEINKLRVFYNHPGFIQAATDRVREALERVPADRREAARLVFTAHSIPVSMTESSPYVKQLHEACEVAARALGRPWTLVYQSRSGPPSQPWLEPDVNDFIRRLEPGAAIVCAPIGFLSDHLEVVYDLDTQAAELCRELGICFHRASTVGTHPAFVSMIRELIRERTEGLPARFVGPHGIDPELFYRPVTLGKLWRPDCYISVGWRALHDAGSWGLGNPGGDLLAAFYDSDAAGNRTLTRRLAQNDTAAWI